MCSCNYGIVDFYSSVVRKARKVHKCSECSTPIQIGEYYEYISATWDGEFHKFKHCGSCSQLFSALDSKSDCCIPLGDLIETMYRCEIIEFNEDTQKWESDYDFITFDPKNPNIPRYQGTTNHV